MRLGNVLRWQPCHVIVYYYYLYLFQLWIVKHDGLI